MLLAMMTAHCEGTHSPQRNRKADVVNKVRNTHDIKRPCLIKQGQKREMYGVLAMVDGLLRIVKNILMSPLEAKQLPNM